MPFVSSVRGSYGLQKRPFPSLFINNVNSSITGGTISTSGGYRIHTFPTGTNPFAYTFNGGTTNGANVTFNVEYLVLAGGGSGGNLGGGGGAGGLITGSIAVPSASNTVVVGAGASAPGFETGHNNSGSTGNNSTVFGLTAFGGGFGQRYNTGQPAGNGGSGGGGGAHQSGGGGGAGGVGENARLGSNVGGNFGGSGTATQGYAGGSALQTDYPNSCNGGQRPGNGGPGAASSISGTSVTYAGGGGGGCYYTSARAEGGVGGGGFGGVKDACGQTNGQNGTNGLGGGGGGSGHDKPGGYQGGAGGDGTVIIRYLVG